MEKKTLTGYNVTDATDIVPVGYASAGYAPTVELIDAKVSYANGTFVVPMDYLRSLSITAVIFSTNAGDHAFGANIYWAKCTEAYNTGSSVSGVACVTVTQPNLYNCIKEINIADGAIDAGDIVQTRLTRDGLDGCETVVGSTHVAGWIVEYIGKS